MSWNQLLSIIKEAAAERDFYATNPPMSCPNDGEPLVAGPAGVLHCQYDGFEYPRDYIAPGRG
jgi:hypothetical protein